MDQPAGTICMCFPCIIDYIGGYIYPVEADQHYPALVRKGFSAAQQKQIAEEWYWIAFERETDVKDYIQGFVTFRDGCYWRNPPPCQGPPYSVKDWWTPSTLASVTGSKT